MYTHFEEYAVSSLSGCRIPPPKVNGKLDFNSDWTQTAFAIAIELSKQGYFEWEEFRQGMIEAIGEWEENHALNDPSWSYYSCWTVVLERLILSSGLLNISEVQDQYLATTECKLSSSAHPCSTSEALDSDSY